MFSFIHCQEKPPPFSLRQNTLTGNDSYHPNKQTLIDCVLFKASTKASLTNQNSTV